MGDQPDQSTSNPINYASGQHFLAEIKYPNIPDVISIDKIFNVLQKIKITSKPLFYKWQTIYRPQHGEIFLEQKYPLTRDPVAGEQFPIVDDGYLWSSIPKPEIKEYQGQQIEVFKWMEGYSPGDQFFTISKTEYRLKFQNNVLFLIHYLKISNPKVPIKTSIPATKVSPLYLQQQFFQYVKQQLAQMNTIRRSPSPNPTMTAGQTGQRTAAAGAAAGGGVNRPVPTQQNKKIIPPPTAALPRIPQAEMPEASIDVFDSFEDYDAAFYRLNFMKPLLSRLFESPKPAPVKKSNNSNILDGIEADLIAATKKKISSLQERTEAFQKSHQETIQRIKNDRQMFWSIFGELNTASFDDGFGVNLDQIYKKFIENEIREMDQDDLVPVYTSL